MVINFLIRPGTKMTLDLSFMDSRLIKVCGHCKVVGYYLKYRMGRRVIKCQLEDNGKKGRELIEWMLN